MLTRLKIKNYALIEDIEIDLNRGLTSMTGETGAGKSIILGAISLLMGNRADLATIRQSEKKCIIEAEFNVERLNLKQLFNTMDFDYQKNTIIRREFSRDGKSRVFVNDTPAILANLKPIVQRMLDVHSQHENLELNNKTYQLQAVDLFAGNAELLKNYKSAYNDYKETIKELADLKENARKLRENADYLNFQLNEFNDADLHPGEQEELEKEQGMLNNSEDILKNLQEIERILEGQEGGPVEVLEYLSSLMSKAGQHVEELGDLQKRLESLRIELEDIRREVMTVSNHVGHDPERAQEVEDRLTMIYKLIQKHKVSSDAELVKKQEDLFNELQGIQQFDEQLEEVEKKYGKAENLCLKLAKELSERRTNAKKEFEKQVIEILRRLSMPECRFQVDLRTIDEFGPDGMNTIDFLFSANKGVTERSIGKIASGGELSRLMLSIKSVLARKSELPTIVFDEIDTGISGEVAEKMGKLILEMSKGTQVLVITHLPQIAALGDEHVRVYKDASGEQSRTRIRKIKGAERIEEVARLLSGETITDEAIGNAKVMLKAVN